MPSKFWENIKLDGLRLMRWGLVNKGTYDTNQNYSNVGFDLVDSGGQGGELNAFWEVREAWLKYFVGFVIVHLVFDGEGEGGLMLLVHIVLLMLCYQQASMLLE